MNDIIDVSLLNGEAALDSINEGIIECTCDEHHTCQECYETIRKLEKTNGFQWVTEARHVEAAGIHSPFPRNRCKTIVGVKGTLCVH